MLAIVSIKNSIVILLVTVVIATLFHWRLDIPAHTKTPEGYYPELYGPVSYFRPYVYWVLGIIAILCVVNIVRLVIGFFLRRKRSSQEHE